MRWTPLSKKCYLVDILWLALCLEVIPIFMLSNDILCVCMLLTCHLCFITTMFMREGDQVKPWSSVQLLAISSLVTLCSFTFSTLNLKITKTLLLSFLFWFCKLASCWFLETTTLVGDAELFVYYCRLFEERRKETYLRLTWEFYNYLELSLWGKLFLLHHFALRFPMSGILKNGVATITCSRSLGGAHVNLSVSGPTVRLMAGGSGPLFISARCGWCSMSAMGYF
jgi:hypothetical protein